jgi:Tfp pilus assembly protein PilX
MKPFSNHSQRGATLVVGLILLTLISLMVVSAYTMSSTNLKAVGNMQFRNEALAAANDATEQVVASSFWTTVAAQTLNVDINDDGNVDYIVTVQPPVCIRASIASDPVTSSLSLTNMSTTGDWNTIWDLDAVVTDVIGGATIEIHSAIRKRLSDSVKQAVCT